MSWTATGGGDHEGQDWIITSNINIAGEHTNIGLFRIISGRAATIPVNSGYKGLKIEANRIEILGTLNGNGAGNLGGNGGSGKGSSNPYCGGNGSSGSGGSRGSAQSAGGGGSGGTGNGGTHHSSSGCRYSNGSSGSGGGNGVYGPLTQDDIVVAGAGGGGGGGCRLAAS
jgi:hypothetical protein